MDGDIGYQEDNVLMDSQFRMNCFNMDCSKEDENSSG